jgi:rhodanese-related sulfurtransferase
MEKCFNTRVAEAREAVSAVTAAEAADLRAQGDVLFVDPRPAEAIVQSTGLIPGARTIALADIEAGRLPDGFAERDIRIVTACQAGPMGALAAHGFVRLGFKHVNYVDGGTQAWLDAGYATQR